MDALPAQTAAMDPKSLHSQLRYKRLEKGRFVWPPLVDGPPAADAGATGAAHRTHRLAPHGCARSGSTAGASLKPLSFNARNLAYALALR
jgi:hypothetical protein